MAKEPAISPPPKAQGRAELLAAAVFVALNLVAPLLLGERYPFTLSPMFSDQPSQYCTYEINDGAGQPLDPEPFGLHLVYDGNPPGLGMGVVPAATLHEFGQIPAEQTVRRHVGEILRKRQMPGPVVVHQHCVGCDAEAHGLAATENVWTIGATERP